MQIINYLKNLTLIVNSISESSQNLIITIFLITRDVNYSNKINKMNRINYIYKNEILS